MQRKLVVGRTDDPLEAEADRIADQVMRMREPNVSTTAAPLRVSRRCAACEREGEQIVLRTASDRTVQLSSLGVEISESNSDGGLVQEVTRFSGQKLWRQELGEEGDASEVNEDEAEYLPGEEDAPGDYGPLETEDDESAGVALPKRDSGGTGQRSVEVPGGDGRALDAPVHDFMSTRFGYSFANVRIHADAAAAESAHSLSAKAYTFGQHVYFGEGRYQPDTIEGRKLLAHELVHVVQQNNLGADRTVHCDEAEKPKEKPSPKEPKKSIVVDLDKQTAFALEDDKVVQKMPISSGRPGNETHTGNFTIYDKDEHHKSSTYGKCVSKSGERKVGNGKGACKDGESYQGTPMPFFQRFNGAEGFHQGPLPGHPDSHGCIRLRTSDAEWLWKWAKEGTPVRVKKAQKVKPKTQSKPKPKPR